MQCHLRGQRSESFHIGLHTFLCIFDDIDWRWRHCFELGFEKCSQNVGLFAHTHSHSDDAPHIFVGEWRSHSRMPHSGYCHIVFHLCLRLEKTPRLKIKDVGKYFYSSGCVFQDWRLHCVWGAWRDSQSCLVGRTRASETERKRGACVCVCLTNRLTLFFVWILDFDLEANNLV